jgi:uncharacterized RDD family membrane protein YckC
MNHYYYGGFWRRAFAFAIDLGLLSILCSILFIMGAMALGLGIEFTPDDYRMNWQTLFESGLTFVIIYNAIIISIDVFYFTYFPGMTGQTLGKRLMDLKIIQVSGEFITPGLAFLRWAGYFLSFFFFLGFIWIALDPKKQGWHDKIAGTLVVDVKYPSTLNRYPKNTLTNGGEFYSS